MPVTKTVVRGGKEISAQLRTRERRFVQDLGGKKIYFKEFGASRDLDRNTGKWATGRLPADQRASEVIHFHGKKEAKTPYGGVRWINQLPSVLGSRKAEEFNLEFFDGGGIPPVLVIVQGGTLGETTREELKQHLSGKGNKHRAAVVEATSTSGSLDSTGTVQVRVERFGSERQSDAMFQTYDKNCEEHVRISFRLPPLFIGKAQDYTFATAYTAYMVAEAQVFYPERDEFDAKVNNTVVKALGIKNYKYRSLPLTLTDVKNQLEALGIAADKNVIDGEELVSKLNEVTGLSMEYTKPPEPPAPIIVQSNTEPMSAGKPKTKATEPGQGSDPTQVNAQTVGTGASIRKGEHDLLKLANDWANALGLDGPDTYLSSEQISAVRSQVAKLTGEDMVLFNELVASHSLAMVGVDQEGLGELCQCANHLAVAH